MHEKEQGKGTVMIQISMISFLHPFLKIENDSKVGDLEQRRNQKAHHTTECACSSRSRVRSSKFPETHEDVDSEFTEGRETTTDVHRGSRSGIQSSVMVVFGSKHRKHTYHAIIPSTIQLILRREFVIAFSCEECIASMHFKTT